jgi:hypothetical protein
MRKGMIYDLLSDVERVVFNLFIAKADTNEKKTLKNHMTYE